MRKKGLAMMLLGGLTGLGALTDPGLAGAPGVAGQPDAHAGPQAVATFSIVAADPGTGEVGIAVASRFFSVGSVVPWARAEVGAVATQSFANTSYGPRGLDLLAAGLSPEEALAVLKRTDPDVERRQVGIVAADGRSVTFTGSGCNPWAGGRAGKNYAVQGNILTGEPVVAALEKTFLETKGDLAQRLYAALVAGDAAGGDSRGRQSAALYVARARAGYGGFNDRAIDVRVDDHPDPIKELGRLTDMARMNDAWNRGWTLFTQKKFAEALVWQEKTAHARARQSRGPVRSRRDPRSGGEARRGGRGASHRSRGQPEAESAGEDRQGPGHAARGRRLRGPAEVTSVRRSGQDEALTDDRRIDS